MFYRLASALLCYPDAALRAALPEIAIAITQADGLSAPERDTLAALVEYLSLADATDLEADYVRHFDMSPELSLHLTHHILGSDKNRGPALIDLAEFYKECGVEISKNELPDYLPLMLEFMSTLDKEEASQATLLTFLSRWKKVLIQLQANLAAADSPYAALVGAIAARAPASADDTEQELSLRASEQAIAYALHRRDAPEQFDCEDERGIEPPIDWSAPPLPAMKPIRFQPRPTSA